MDFNVLTMDDFVNAVAFLHQNHQKPTCEGHYMGFVQPRQRWTMGLANDPRVEKLPYSDVCAAWEICTSHNEIRRRLGKPEVDPYRWLLNRHGLAPCDWWWLPCE
jgi:hypothetical protein